MLHFNLERLWCNGLRFSLGICRCFSCRRFESHQLTTYILARRGAKNLRSPHIGWATTDLCLKISVKPFRTQFKSQRLARSCRKEAKSPEITKLCSISKTNLVISKTITCHFNGDYCGGREFAGADDGDADLTGVKICEHLPSSRVLLQA
ncbi:hypothetical protein PoB_007485500 [Plakobranchus ocellatus]|uniref:Uncharacterized protein n=1 Tax=Plakobranchus ocellatus TaxID=259542 RepID=A0AAV4DWG3_9GAST|nr:hypothetical protein PoB_007485500 [Plakobranchus ocellatus]